MKRIILLIGFTALSLGLLVGCTSFRLRKQLDDQLSQGDRFYVEIVSFDADARTARVRLIDRSQFGSPAGDRPVHSYRHDGTRWVQVQP